MSSITTLAIWALPPSLTSHYGGRRPCLQAFSSSSSKIVLGSPAGGHPNRRGCCRPPDHELHRMQFVDLAGFVLGPEAFEQQLRDALALTDDVLTDGAQS